MPVVLGASRRHQCVFCALASRGMDRGDDNVLCGLEGGAREGLRGVDAEQVQPETHRVYQSDN
jgi:hypothetical protein